MEAGRAYSTIAVKSLSDERREFSGLATSPVPDRVADVIEPLGCKYRNPLVLLRAHDHTMPIGEVRFDRPTKAGITFRAKIPHISEPGALKDRLDMAWGEIKHGLVRAVSVGFRPLEVEPLPSGGARFTKAEIYELSTVAVPAQELATIDQVKAIDAAVLRGEAPSTSPISSPGRKAIDEVEYIMSRMAELREKRAAKNDKIVQYSQGQHDMISFGFQMAFAGVATLRNLIGELEDKVEAQGPAYKGVWRAGRTYPAGSFVTHGGSMWHADKATERKPGEGDWTLAVKRGADAK